MKLVNRQGFRVHYGPEFTRWIGSLPDLPKGFALTAESLNQHPTVYLIELCEDDADLESYLKAHSREIFEKLLAEWVPDTHYWPSPLPMEKFIQWFKLETFDMVKDFSNQPLIAEVYADDFEASIESEHQIGN